VRNQVSPTVSIHVVEAQQVVKFQDQLVTIYRDAFRRPPYGKDESEVIDFAHTLPGHVGLPGFRMVVALEKQKGRALGFAYGFGNSPDHFWYREAAKVLPLAVVEEWMAGGFRLVEIAVTPESQGQGIGGRLHDRLLRGQPYQRATLLTMAADTVAFKMYIKRGWKRLLEQIFFPGFARPYCLMGLEIGEEGPSSPGF